ncbi:hypothetical protein Mnod_3777 [Methylobacterium nodulans ORS 2060]|uniref:Uncharacterized protein n=1 Tax=Methylobacterium nodulans (strain LMG 21967 / CNCM I-2342 / ORS 2060) TaxID=460265 RepID=B8IRE3_METNO|nr:hypothetical protein Mnod_3777 [Methylobacterium nodulans ORS 2060]
MSATDSQSPAVFEWSRRLASLSPGQPPCSGLRFEDRVRTLANARSFVGDASRLCRSIWKPCSVAHCLPDA